MVLDLPAPVNGANHTYQDGISRPD